MNDPDEIRTTSESHYTFENQAGQSEKVSKIVSIDCAIDPDLAAILDFWAVLAMGEKRRVRELVQELAMVRKV